MAGVDEFITNAQTYADSILNEARTQIAYAVGQAGTLRPGISAGAGPGGIASIPGLYLLITPPEIVIGQGNVPVWPGSTFSDPGFSATAPTLQDVPLINLDAGAPGAVPIIAAFVDPVELRPGGSPADDTLLTGIPVVSDINVIDPTDLLAYINSLPVPTIHEITVNAAPAYSPPQFLGTSPTLPGDAPDDLDITLKEQYSLISPVMLDAITTKVDAFIDGKFPGFTTGLAALETRLTTYLAGGTALTAEVQDAIFERAANKTDAEYRRLRYGVYAEGALAGHTIPSAILLSKVTAADKARRDANASVSRDLMIKIADMEQQNMQFAVTQSIALRSVMLTSAIQYYSGLVQINGQALEYARSVVEQIAKVYELAIRRSEIEARIYESEANIYDSKTKGALAVLQAYSEYVKGLEAVASLDVARATVYRAQLEAVQAQATAYKAYTDSLLAKASIERMRVDIYRSRIDAYAAQVSAWTARWNGYKAAVDGEAAGVAASAEAVRGYAATVQAYEARIRAQSSQIDGVARRNDGLVRNYEVAAQVYKTIVGAKADVSRAEVDSFGASIRGYEAEQSKVTEQNRALISQYESSIRALVAAADLQQKILMESHNLDIHRISTLAQLSTAAANNYTAVAQSALSGINSLAAQIVNQ
jgi:hypothetical protein